MYQNNLNYVVTITSMVCVFTNLYKFFSRSLLICVFFPLFYFFPFLKILVIGESQGKTILHTAEAFDNRTSFSSLPFTATNCIRCRGTVGLVVIWDLVLSSREIMGQQVIIKNLVKGVLNFFHIMFVFKLGICNIS